MYDGDAAGENYLRGVQEAADDGTLEFTTIFPAATPAAGRTCTSRCTSPRRRHQRDQQALRLRQLRPAGRLRDRLRDRGYEQSVSNLAQVSLDSDGIFSDGYSLQMAKVTGSVDEGYVATLNVPV